MKYKLPNFLIVGAGKSGSTSLYQYINQHPDVFMPDNKEPNFFVADYQKLTNPSSPTYSDDRRRMIFNFDHYKKLFEEAGDKKAVGEATVTYLYKYDEAIPKIKKYLGKETKIIIILREPVARTFSNYAYAIELGYETLPFREALNAEEQRMKDHWASIFAYKGQSEYYEQVEAYLENFDNILILLTEELKNKPEATMQKVFDFLELENIELDYTKIYNPSGIPKWRLFHRFLNQRSPLKTAVATILYKFTSRDRVREIARNLRKKNIKGKLELKDNYIRKELSEYYRLQIDKLEGLINKDLSVWKNTHV